MTITGLAVGHIANEKEVDGLAFPLTLVPLASSGSRSCADLVAAVRREQEGLAEALRQHGAIVLRGFDVHTAEDFSDVVEALGWDEFEYVGAGDRVRVAPRAIKPLNNPPVDKLINFHHEMSLIRKSPAKIIFYCLVISPEGGQTSVLRSDVIVKKMEEKMPEMVEKLQKGGMVTVLHTTAPAWKRLLKSDDPIMAEKRALEILGCNSVIFNDDGTADIIYGPTNPMREINGKRVWFNTLLSPAAPERSWVRYGDGTPLPQDAAEVYEKILDEYCVDVNWEKGDVLVLDNMLVQHARRPGKPPRSLLLALTD